MEDIGKLKSRTLYVSDLDGTLLQSNETLSKYTIETISELVDKGMLFSYATARSLVTAKKATKGLEAKIPLVVYNGAFVMDNVTGEIMLSNFFGEDIHIVIDDLICGGIFPIVYSFIEKKEKFSYIRENSTQGLRDFIDTRKGDKRDNPVNIVEDLHKGDIFYLTCIDNEERLEGFYEKYKDKYSLVYHKDIYSGEQWLEIMPKEANKANGIKKLKSFLGCDRLVVFGDGKNDIPMFEIADEAYAVENAVDELKAIATGIIEGNNLDGVAKWLRKRYE